jgi:hypothetical protein
MADDHESQVKALVAPGWPAVEPKIDEIIGWLEDPNCTGCRAAFEFLKSVGRPLVPHVKRVFQEGADDVRCALLGIVEEWPREWVAELDSELETLSRRRDEWDVNLRALGLLVRHRLRGEVWLKQEVDNRIRVSAMDLDELRKMRQALD